MAQRVLSTKHKQIPDMESRLVVVRGEVGGSGMDRGFGGWWIRTVIFGMDGLGSPTVQHRQLCVIG